MEYDIKGSKTEENLKLALQGEALAHLKYQFYRSMISNFSKEFENILDEIVHNEKEHGKIWFKLLHDGSVPVDSVNLKDAIEGEHHEHTRMYPEFAEVARDEGFDDIADLFESVAIVEGRHCEEFSDLLKHIEGVEATFYDDDLNSEWKCLNCGHVVVGGMAPSECPVCNHPLKYFVKL